MAGESKLVCFQETLESAELSYSRVALLLVMAADYYMSLNRSFDVVLMQDELYDQALSFSSKPEIRVHVEGQKKLLRELNATMFLHRLRYVKDEPVKIIDFLPSHRQLLDKCMQFFSAHVVQLETLYPQDSSMIDGLFLYLASKMHEKGLISKENSVNFMNQLNPEIGSRCSL